MYVPCLGYCECAVSPAALRFISNVLYDSTAAQSRIYFVVVKEQTALAEAAR